MSNYWNDRFGSGGKVWGDKPSGTAVSAKDIFNKYCIEDILVIGSGYGRHTNYFYNEGLGVEGIECTLEGIRLAKADNPNISYYHGSVFDMPFRDKKYSGIYCFNVLHLFTEELRDKLVELCKKVLKPDGIMYFVNFSEQEASYGTGPELEYNTFESKSGKPIHYYTDEDIKEEFSQYNILDSGLYIDKENHGIEGEHEHILRYIVVQNSK